MNAQDYISSGAIETCIMGLADEEDWLELQQMVLLYPEVKAEKEKIEIFQEQLHLASSVAAPAALKEKIFSSLTFNASHEEATIIDMPESVIPSVEKPAAKPMVVPMVPTPKPVRWLQRAVAASVILLMGSVLLNFYFYSNSVSYRKKYDALAIQQNSLMAKNQAMDASFKMIKDPKMKQVVMGATPAKPGSMATIFWDIRSKDVYLLVNNLPKPSPGMQYQLWAIVDGKPVDAGMISTEDGNELLKMHNIPSAQAFAITLEKKAGSPTPSMDAMYVMGTV